MSAYESDEGGHHHEAVGGGAMTGDGMTGGTMTGGAMTGGRDGIRDKVVAITGAGSGIGAATALLLGARGANVVP
ncbi:hypothetical protein ABZ389_31130, partial [Streptomyces sp. NPDC005877]